MSKSDFIDSIASKAGLPKSKVDKVIDAFVETINKELRNNGKVRVNKLGTFELKTVPARSGRNPRTGEKIKIEAGKRVSFRGASSLKRSVS